MSFSNLPFFVIWEDEEALSKHPEGSNRMVLEPGVLYGVHNNINTYNNPFTWGSYIYGKGLSKIFNLDGSIRGFEYLERKYNLKEGDTVYYNNKSIENANFEIKFIDNKYTITLWYEKEFIPIDLLQTQEEYRSNMIDDILS